MQYKPDISQRVINNAVSGFQNQLASQFKKINKFLPKNAQLPEEFAYPGASINKLMALSYVSGLGLRAAVPVRDALQVVTTTLPILGPKTFARVLKTALTSKGWARSNAAGALLHRANVGELYGDIFSEIPVGGKGKLDTALSLSNKLLAPSRWGHNIGRDIAYHGFYSDTLLSLRKFRQGKIGPDKFINDSGLWFTGKADRQRFVTMAMNQLNPSKEVAKNIALELVDRTLWPYRRGTQPGILKTGAGRIFGQYGMWPMNYTEYLKTVGQRALEPGTRGQALKAGGLWLGTNLAAYALFESAGVDAGKWLFLSPSGYGGGPHFEAVQAAFRAPEDTAEGRKARKTLLEYPMDFVPGYNQISTTLSTLSNEDYWDPYTNQPTEKGMLRILGFHPINEKEEERYGNFTPEQKARYQLGLNPGKADPDTDLTK
jgi:hypothetical protein